jgi:CPA1 family monovalent cation:H+ antiporter
MIAVEEHEARRVILETALKKIKTLRSENHDDSHHLSTAYDDVLAKYKRRLSALTGQSYEEHGIDAHDHGHIVSVSLDLLRLERDTAVQLRNEGRINDEVLRNLERELDLTETRLAHPASG